MTRSTYIALTGALTLAASCGPEEPMTDAVALAETQDATEGTFREAAIYFAITRAIEAPLDGAIPLRQALQRARDQLAEALPDCATATIEEATHSVTAVMRNCPGRPGLRNVSGTVVFVFASASDGGAEVSVRNQGDLRVGPATITAMDTVLTLQRQPAAERFVLTVTRSRVTTRSARGAITTSTAMAMPQMTWGYRSLCFGLRGRWLLDVAEPGVDASQRQFVHTINDLRRCTGQCPQAADAVIVLDEPATGRELRVSYYGSEVARWVSFTHGVRTGAANFRLACSD